VSAPGVTDLVDPDVLVILRAAASDLYADAAGTLDLERALSDLAVVRDVTNILAASPDLRARLALQHAHDLLTPDASDARQRADRILALLKSRGDTARREAAALKRGTAEERRTTRAEATLAQLRGERDAAVARSVTASATIDSLRTKVAELDDAVRAESRPADLSVSTADATQSAMRDPRLVARRLQDALELNAVPLDKAAVVVPPEHRDTALGWVKAVLAELANPTVARRQAAARALAVEMLGGGVEVGGSCALVSADSTRILVDAGTRPGAQTSEQMMPPGLTAALAAGPVDAIVLTHAHADHIGWVPAILAAYPQIPVYATEGTADLLPTMWQDSAKIYSGRDRAPGPVPYTEQDVRTALGAVVPLPYGRLVQVGDLSFTLFPAGHILGAAGVHVTDGQHRVVISGDVSRDGQQTVSGWDLPEDAINPDLLVLESTYGATPINAARSAVVDDFIRDVQRTVAGGGRVLVPAFAIGRAQEIAMLCAERLPNVPVRIDGLARDITTLYEKHTGANGKPLSIWSDLCRPVPRGHTSSEVEQFKSGVIVTTSGMLAAGPVVTWARSILPDPASAVAIVGYQEPNSPGGHLLRKAESGEPFTLMGPDRRPVAVEVNAAVRRYGLGAHASSADLVAIATQVRAASTMLVHGDQDAREALSARLSSRYLDLVVPDKAWRAPA
jgi:Cft2 family RNA processing exonuclease